MSQSEDFLRIGLRKARGQDILIQEDWKEGWASRVPEAMFSVAQRKLITLGENKGK